MKPITIALVHFRTCDLSHFERAWYSLCQQRFDLVDTILVYDNNSTTPPMDLAHILDASAGRVPEIHFLADLHGDETKTHPYSVNRVLERVRTPWLLFTRSDYLLDFNAVVALWREAMAMEMVSLKPFVSGWCFQSAYDRAQQDLPPVDIEQYPWRTQGLAALTEAGLNGFCFHETDLDAGVWLTRPLWCWEAGGMNEQLSAWGYSQSTFQRQLVHQVGVTCRALPQYISFHQQHGIWSRNVETARQQYTDFGGGA